MEIESTDLKNYNIVCYPVSLYINKCTTYYDKINELVYVHRINGPARIWDDPNLGKWWYFKGELHRDDGPAMEETDKHTRGWYWHGTEILANDLDDFKKQVKLLCLK